MASPSGTNNGVGPRRSLSRRMSRMPTMMDGEEDIHAVDSELVPSSLAAIAPILRVANEIEPENRRVAYLCKNINLAVLIEFREDKNSNKLLIICIRHNLLISTK